MGAILPSYESFKRLGLVRNGAVVANIVALRSKNEYLEQMAAKKRYYTPISSFHSEGSSAIKSFIMAIHSASSRTSTVTPLLRTYSSGP